jgi:hypothetical protein
MRLSMTEFVDIVLMSGTPKVTKVKEIKTRDKYEPAHDFYKSLREHIIFTHKNDGSKKDLDKIIGQISDKKKLNSYPAVVQGYKKWWGRNTLYWIEPPRGTYNANGVDVTVNPELGLKFSGNNYFIKLYFKAEPLSKAKANIATNLMQLLFMEANNKNTTMGILDIRNSKIFTYTGGYNMKPLIDAELAYIANIWPVI